MVGPAPSVDRLEGATPAELRDAESMFAAGIEASRPERRLRVARLAYLVQHAPGKTIGQAIASLTLQELEEFEALTGDEL